MVPVWKFVRLLEGSYDTDGLGAVVPQPRTSRETNRRDVARETSRALGALCIMERPMFL
jgi:hypothetical protein